MELSAEEIARYAQSPVHLAVARRDYAGLRRILSTLPRFPRAGEVTTEEQSILAEQRADVVSASIDRRDVPGRETALHVAVRMGDATSVEMLMSAGADWSLQNEQGWSALQEAVCARQDAIAMIITRHYQPLAWAKWCRRLPRVIATAGRMRDFYMEITFHFESSVIPFVGRIAPSDTYRIWKRGSNLRADMTLAGFDGFRIQRSDQSFLFLGEGSEDGRLSPGSLIVLTHKEKEITNALEGAGIRPSDAEVAQEVALMSQTNMYRPGIDVTQAELVPHLNWRRQDRTEMVGPWKAKIYDMLHVMVSVKSRRVPGAMTDEELFAVESDRLEAEPADYDDILTQEEKEQLDNVLRMEHSEGFEDDDGYGFFGPPGQCENGKVDPDRTESGEADGEKDRKGSWFGWNRKALKDDGPKIAPNLRNNAAALAGEVDKPCPGEGHGSASGVVGDDPSKILKRFSRLAPDGTRRSVDHRASDFQKDDGTGVRKGKEKAGKGSGKKEAGKKKSRPGGTGDSKHESEYKKGLRPVLWLSPDFPLKTDEFLPLLDILANKVKAVRRLRELLTTKLPPGTFPVKVAIPIVPTIRVVITFTKFEELQPPEEFSTPLSSPAYFQDVRGKDAEASHSSSSWMSWMRGSYFQAREPTCLEDHLKDDLDPFHIPSDYTWIDMNEKKRRMKTKRVKNKKGKRHTSRNAEGSLSDVEE